MGKNHLTFMTGKRQDGAPKKKRSKKRGPNIRQRLLKEKRETRKKIRADLRELERDIKALSGVRRKKIN